MPDRAFAYAAGWAENAAAKITHVVCFGDKKKKNLLYAWPIL